MDTTRVENIERAAEELNKILAATSSNVRIEVETHFFRGDYMVKLIATFSVGEAPDIIAMKNLPTFVDGG